ncbi:MAG TPA: type II toxin-antitoxin system ParD family antitoxin [Allosphingosinicella sp.]|nr:type II toxin-antitoxin system ParD family antitoxin [Allosphingosinicella sp.]
MPRSSKAPKFRTHGRPARTRTAGRSFIEEAMKSGRYASRAEVLREGLGVVRDREAAWKRLEAELRKGIDSLNGGKGIPLEEAFAQVRAKIREKRNGRKDAA